MPTKTPTPPKLSRRQRLVLRFLAAMPHCAHSWTSITAALVMHREKRVNGRVAASSLVRIGMAEGDWRHGGYRITDAGLRVARQLEDET